MRTGSGIRRRDRRSAQARLAAAVLDAVGRRAHRQAALPDRQAEHAACIALVGTAS